MVKTTVYLPEQLHGELKRVAREDGTSEADLIRRAIRHELLGRPADAKRRAARRARLLDAIGTLDGGVYPPGYLDDVRSGWSA